MKPRCVSRSARRSRGARPSGPARTTSTGGHRRVDGATSVRPSAFASDDGHSAESTQTAPPEPGPLERDIPHVVVGSAVLPMGRMALPRDHDHPEIRHRREHARPRPHDDVVSPFQDLQPPPISRSPVSPDQRADTLPERLDDRRRGRRNRRRLGHQHHRAPPSGQTATNDLDGRTRPRPPAPAEERTRPNRPRPPPESEAPFRYDEKRLDDEAGAPPSTPPRASPCGNGVLLGRDPGRRHAPDHRGQRSDVALAHPPHQLEHRFVEEPDGRHDLLHVERPRAEHLGRLQHPPADQPAVERDLDERADARVELAGEQVRERPVEAEDRAVDADGDGALEDEAALHVRPRPAS